MQKYTISEFESMRPLLQRSERTYAKIDLSAIEHNGKRARALFPGKKLLSVLKADAYGHGIDGVVPAYETFTDWYAVATVEEGLAVRAKTEKPILLFGAVPEGKLLLAAENGLTFTVGSLPYARLLSRVMLSAGKTASCQIKIDTGLNRSGLRWREDEDSLSEILAARSLPGLDFCGTYTHFACGEGQEPSELAFTGMQFSRFQAACGAMEAAGLSLGLRHCCATGGGLVHSEYCLDMVRMGMLPLGMSYSDGSMHDCGLLPAMTWVSFLTQIKHIRAGETVSYDRLYRADRDRVIGMVSCGYGDGYHRFYSGHSHVLIGGKKAPVLGRIAMDCMMIDLTDVDKPTPGMEVILLGSDGNHEVTTQMLSKFGESVNGEVTCSVSSRVPRFYVR